MYTVKQIVILILVATAVTGCGDTRLDKRDIEHAEDLIGITFSDTEIDTMYAYLQRNRLGYDTMRMFSLGNEDFPALLFEVTPRGFEWPDDSSYIQWDWPDSDEKDWSENDISMATILQLGALIRSGRITSMELTRLYLDRIEQYDPVLHCVVTVTGERAIQQAEKADLELARGIDRGPLHGIPFGVKDLLAVEGYPTTWGAQPYSKQSFDYTATVVKKLEDAGAVLIAKLTSGALARGDVWFGGQTKNPWDTLEGASGSSAGSGSATAAGLVAFSIGTETLGSITSPSARNGITGLRPTYGRVSRHGVMSLSWSMDKVGPMCRSAEDCALVFDVIRGLDSLDQTTLKVPFGYEPTQDFSEWKIGYLASDLERDTSTGKDNLLAALEEIQSWGVSLTEVSLPEKFPYAAFDIILRAESAAFFDALILENGDDDMVQQDERSRANSLRQARFIPAVEYLQANRYRRKLQDSMYQVMRDFDVLISPNRAFRQLLITNLTGYPAVAVPTGIDSLNHPTGMTLIGNLFEEGKLLEFADYFQEKTTHHLSYPPLTSGSELPES